jgi:hypothetical protein
VAAPEDWVKTFVVLVLTVAALFLWQRNPEKARPTGSVMDKPASSPSTAVSQHNWAKNSLDRAHEAIDAVQRARAGGQEP